MSVRPQVTLARGSTELRDSTFRISSVAACTRVARCDFGSVVTDILNPPLDLSTTQVLLTSWGCPRIDGAALSRLPRPRLIAHAAGSVKGQVNAVCWRGITFSRRSEGLDPRSRRWC